MKTIIKVILCIVAGLVLLFGVFIGVLFYMGKHAHEEIEEATKFAKHIEKEACLTEISQRMRDCEGGACLMSIAIFGSTCLDQAQGSRQFFCQGKPVSYGEVSKNEWAEGYCAKENLDDVACEISFMSVMTYCSDNFQE